MMSGRVQEARTKETKLSQIATTPKAKTMRNATTPSAILRTTNATRTFRAVKSPAVPSRADKDVTSNKKIKLIDEVSLQFPAPGSNTNTKKLVSSLKNKSPRVSSTRTTPMKSPKQKESTVESKVSLQIDNQLSFEQASDRDIYEDIMQELTRNHHKTICLYILLILLFAAHFFVYE